MVVSVDGLLERLGTRYQWLVLLVLSSWLTQVFLHHHLHHHYLTTPPHHCKLPKGWKERDALPTVLISRTSTYRKDSQGPGEHMTTGYSRCLMYRDPRNHRNGTQSCVLGYAFSLRQEEWSVVAEWGLVCDRTWIREWVVTLYLIGLVIGGLLFGFLADRFGRRNLLVVSVVSVSVTGLALHFVRRLIVFLGLRFLQAIFVQGIYVTGWTLLGELFPPRWRCRALVSGGMTRPLGVALGAAAALTVQHWRGLQLTTALPLLMSILYYWMVPESLRWLLTRGKTRRARQVAAQLARHNLLTLPPTAHAQMDQLAAHVYIDLPWESLATLFRTPRLRRHVLVTVFMWLAVSLADGTFRRELLETVMEGDEEEERGLEEQLSVLGGPGHLGAALWAGVEAGAVVLSAVLTTLLYRRAFLVVTLLLAAAFALSVTCVRRLVDETRMDVMALATALRFVGVLVLGCVRVGAGVLVVEVTPTTARASAVGLCAAHAALGEILATLMAAVANLTYPSVPWLVSAGGCLLAAALTLLLPETSGTTLPDVVDEAEVVGLAHGGDIFKSCYVGYGRSPYWTELDGEGVERTLQGPCERGGQFRSISEKSEQSLDFDADVNNSRMPMESHGPPRSLNSHTSSDSLASLMSLVDVSRVNGNNSDTSDSSDHDSLGATRGRRLNVEKDAAMKNIITNYSVFQEASPEGPKETNSPSSGQKDDAADFVFTSDGDPLSGQSDNKEVSLEAMVLCDEAVENDFSLSVFSLKFRHIKRPVSPTDRRIRADLHYSYSSSSGYTSKPGKTLVQEYISQHSSSGDGMDSQSNSLSGNDVTEGTLYRAVPVHSTLSDSPDVFQHREQPQERQESSSNNPGDNQVRLQPVHIRKRHETNAIHRKIEAAPNTRHFFSSRQQARGSLSVSPSPEPKPKRRRPSPATQVPTCGNLSDKPHPGKEGTCSSSPPVRYFLTTLLDNFSSSMTDYHSTDIVHPTRGVHATRDGDGDRRSEGGEADLKSMGGKSQVGSARRNEKPAVSRRVNRTLSTRTDGKNRTGEVDATVGENDDKSRCRSRWTLSPTPPPRDTKEYNEATEL